jgi:16S rRNA C967 or C1407 C5-methylase (RsmB/RsmF family)
LQLFEASRSLTYRMSMITVPAVERIVYSTCSVHQRENEDVVKSVLPRALSLGFRLETALPQWKYRGLPTFDGGLSPSIDCASQQNWVFCEVYLSFLWAAF